MTSAHIVSPFYLSLQCWEYGISLCRELAFQYETLYDYQSLSWIRVSNILCTYLCVLLLSNKLPLWCWKETFSSLSSSSSSAVWGVCGIKHNVLITCARLHSTGKAHFGSCVIKSLFIVTLLHVCFLWQKMEAAYYDNIIEQQRIEPEFFRMGFYGRKFPFFLRVGRNPGDLKLEWD